MQCRRINVTSGVFSLGGKTIGRVYTSSPVKDAVEFARRSARGPKSTSSTAEPGEYIVISILRKYDYTAFFPSYSQLCDIVSSFSSTELASPCLILYLHVSKSFYTHRRKVYITSEMLRTEAWTGGVFPLDQLTNGVIIGDI